MFQDFQYRFWSWVHRQIESAWLWVYYKKLYPQRNAQLNGLDMNEYFLPLEDPETRVHPISLNREH